MDEDNHALSTEKLLIEKEIFVLFFLKIICYNLKYSLAIRYIIIKVKKKDYVDSM